MVKIAINRVIVLIIVLLILTSCSDKGVKISGNINSLPTLTDQGNLSTLLAKQNISAEYALLVASDGTAVFLTGKSLSELQIVKEGRKFNTKSDALPPVTNLYDLKEICVYVSDFPLKDYQTPFSIRMQSFDFLGESSMNGHIVRKYKLTEVES